jgi:L-asparagine transporter-like permease
MWESFFRKKSIDKILSDQLEMENLAGDHLVRNLGVRDLTFMGVAAIIGASIFSAIGQASANGGPAVSMLFVFTALACMFTAFVTHVLLLLFQSQVVLIPMRIQV